MKKTTKESGAKRIAKQHKTLIWVAPNEGEKQTIRIAAAMLNLPMGQFLLQTGLAAARDVMKKFQKSAKSS